MWFIKSKNKSPEQTEQEDIPTVPSASTETADDLKTTNKSGLHIDNEQEPDLPVFITPPPNGSVYSSPPAQVANRPAPPGAPAFPLPTTFEKKSTPSAVPASRLGPVKPAEKALTVSGVRDVAKDVFMENFPRLRQVAHVEAERRIELFLSELDVRLSRSLTNDQVNKFNDPAILHTLNQALQATALQNEATLRKILADLIVKRVMEDESSLKRIVYTEAIKTVPLLTAEMLDMLALTFLLRRAHILDINTWDDFRSRVWPFLEPFLGFKGTQAELQHLEYAGCGIVAPGTTEEVDAVRILRASYSALFQRGLSFDEAKSLRIPESAITDAIYADDQNVCYRFRFRSRAELEQFFHNHPQLSPGVRQRIVAMMEKCMGSLENCYERLISEVPASAALVSTWNNSPIRFLDPTSVGLVIGATHFEGRTGQQVPIDVWIN